MSASKKATPAPFPTASRYALTVYRCPNDRLRWWVGLENTVTGEHEVIAGTACACHKRPERVRTWAYEGGLGRCKP